MGNLKYKEYIGSVEYSPEDKCLFGKVLGISKGLISYEGKSVAELESDFRLRIKDYLRYCIEEGIQPRTSYSGTINVRLNPDLHSQIAQIAQNNNTTINSLIRDALTEYIKHLL